MADRPQIVDCDKLRAAGLDEVLDDLEAMNAYADELEEKIDELEDQLSEQE